MNRLAKWSLTTVLASILAGPATAQNMFLVAQPFTQMMPDGTEVPMWGYASATDASCPSTTVTSGPSAPGPEITVNHNDSDLSITLCNELDEPVSVVIPGQAMPKDTAGGTMHAPVLWGAGKFSGRVRSFTAEAAAGNGSQTYVWEDVKPGTYLYHSGTHQQVQMQMGLFGAVKKDDSPGKAYGPASNYNKEIVLLYSEIDTALHTAVNDGDYDPFSPGHASDAGFNASKTTSIKDYQPDYHLINGQPFPATPPSIVISDSNVLFRFLNAGLNNHVPVIQGLHLDLIAEDGYPYPFAHNQYSVRLPAGTTRDAMLDVVCPGGPPASKRHVIYDGRMRLTNAGLPQGGLMVNLHLCGSPADSDNVMADGLPDTQDNCIMTGNGPDNLDAGGNSQRDTNGDGFGNICDPDVDNDGNVNFNDLSMLGAAFFSAPGDANWDPDVDFDGDGNVNFNDLTIMGAHFFGSPGPSALAE